MAVADEEFLARLLNIENILGIDSEEGKTVGLTAMGLWDFGTLGQRTTSLSFLNLYVANCLLFLPTTTTTSITTSTTLLTSFTTRWRCSVLHGGSICWFGLLYSSR